MSKELTGQEFPCMICGKLRYYKQSLTIKILNGRKTYCSHKCQKIGYKIQFAGKNNPAYGKIYRTKKDNPDWAKKISEGCIRNQINVGDKNGMKNPETAKRMAKTRRERVTSDPEYRKQCSESTRNGWAAGRYDNAKVGQCDWYDYIKKDGTIVKCQGTWEFAYACYLDQNDIRFVAHKGRISYVDENGVERSYYPDFYLIDSDEYIDIKSDYTESLQPMKLVHVIRSNPNMKLRIIRKDELKELSLL